MNRHIPTAVALIPVCLVALTLAACGSKHESDAGFAPQGPVAPVRVETVQSKPRMLIEEVVGTVQAKRRASLESKVSGRIAAMPVLLGQHVKAGEVLVRLDTAEIQARLEQAGASLEQAQREWKRTSALFEQQAATRAEFDAAQSRYHVAKGVADEAKAMMNYAAVAAPFDGVVTKKWADVGDFAAPGKPLLSVEDPSILQIEADVPQALTARITLNAPIEVRLDNPSLDGPSGTLAGTIGEIAPASDPLTRTFRVKVNLPQQPGVISGQFARILVPVGESRSLRVPASAVVQRGQLEIVFVVADRHARLHLVKTGKRIGDEWEILSGLDEDATVVFEGASQLTDGQAVDVK